MRIFETVTRELIEAGLVDRERVGLLGFSRNGWHVEYTLTHSEFPFAAALVSDNSDPSYVLTTLMGQESTNANVIGAEPFGPGLANWLTDSPGFNADRLRTPLRLVEQSFSLWGALLRWELFSRARHIGAPAEIYIVPNPERGAHNTQNPQQVLALQHGTIDWFNFWLRGIEDPDAMKTQQYSRWRELRAQHDAMRVRPRPPLLEWHVTSVTEEK